MSVVGVRTGMPRRRRHFRFWNQTRPRGDYRLAAGPRRLVSQKSRAYYFRCRRSESLDGRSGHREVVMLTRRSFTGFASCALCAITEFIATEASAQGAPPPSCGVNRKILSKTDGPAGYETILVEAEIEAGVAVGRHTHPGIESAYV